MALSDSSMAREFEAAIAWWRAAGVDCDFTDDATAWLAEAPLDAPPPGVAAPAASGERALKQPPPGGFTQDRLSRLVSAPVSAEVVRPDLLGDSPPGDLAAFRHWWGEEHALAPPGALRIAPRGEAGAQVMILVPQPEEGDRTALLEGPQGRLLAAMLRAMGLDESAVYVASALPCFTPMADLAALAEAAWGAVLTHHIALAAPRRVLAFGVGLAPMLGAKDAQALREINQGSGSIPVMVSETLDSLMEMPRLKARFWRRWMEWSAP